MDRRQFIAGTAAGLSRAGSVTAAAVRSAVRAGLAEADITPEIGMEQPGNYSKNFHSTFHDPCKVRAAAFESGSERLAVVGVDALMIPRQVVEAARRTIQQRCGIESDAVLIAASHSHTSGPVGMVQPGEYDHASALVQRLAYEHSSCANARYLETVTRQIVAAVSRAWDARQPVQCSFGAGHESTVAFNRRFRMKNGLEYTHPGRGNPDIVEPAGPVDPQVGVIGVWAGKALLGCIVNFTCHATTGPEGISANWIYYLEKTVRGVYGNDAVVVFLQGFSGDITQFNNRGVTLDPDPNGQAQIVGCSVGAEALKALVRSQRTTDVHLRAASRVLEIQRRRPSRERAQKCLDIAARSRADAGDTRWVFAKEVVLADALAQRSMRMPAEVQALQIGPALMLSAPGEMFCELGLRMKRQSRFPLTFAVELANGCIGYVPTAEALGPRGGGYETRLTSYTNAAPDAGPVLIDAASGLAARWIPDPLPAGAKAPPFNPAGKGIGSEAWSYGNVGPELE